MVDSLKPKDISHVPYHSLTVFNYEHLFWEQEPIQPLRAGINCQQMRINHRDTLKWRRRHQLTRSFRFLMVRARQMTANQLTAIYFWIEMRSCSISRHNTFFDYDNHLSQFSGALIIHSNKDLKSKLRNFWMCIDRKQSFIFTFNVA